MGSRVSVTWLTVLPHSCRPGAEQLDLIGHAQPNRVARFRDGRSRRHRGRRRHSSSSDWSRVACGRIRPVRGVVQGAAVWVRLTDDAGRELRNERSRDLHVAIEGAVQASRRWEGEAGRSGAVGSGYAAAPDASVQRSTLSAGAGRPPRDVQSGCVRIPRNEALPNAVKPGQKRPPDLEKLDTRGFF